MHERSGYLILKYLNTHCHVHLDGLTSQKPAVKVQNFAGKRSIVSSVRMYSLNRSHFQTKQLSVGQYCQFDYFVTKSSW